MRVCVCPGEVDDVLDSVCIVQHSRNSHRPAPIMVSRELLVIVTLFLHALIINEPLVKLKKINRCFNVLLLIFNTIIS